PSFWRRRCDHLQLRPGAAVMQGGIASAHDNGAGQTAPVTPRCPICNPLCPKCNRTIPLRGRPRAYLTGEWVTSSVTRGTKLLHSSRRRVMAIDPDQPTPQPSFRMRLSRRGLSAVAGLGMLAAAGALVTFTPADHGAGLMSGTSALAAETTAPPAVAMPSFADLVERLKPTVVSVYVDAEIGNVAQLPGRGR